MKTVKTPKIFTVRNAAGQFLGTYLALTAEQAMQRHRDEQLVTAATFRRSQPYTPSPLTAAVEDAVL